MYSEERIRKFPETQNLLQVEVAESAYKRFAQRWFLFLRALRSLPRKFHEQMAKPWRSLWPLSQRHSHQQRLLELNKPLCLQPLSTSIVSSQGEIAKLTGFVASLIAEPAMLDPRFFLASVLGRKWRPCVCKVTQGERIAGLLYFKEPLVAGIRTRIAFGDDSLGSLVVAHPDEIESVTRCAFKALLKHMIAVRLLVRSERLPLLHSVDEKAMFGTYRGKRHAHLELPRTYDDFLQKLGPKTRRNFRYYRRKSELTGHEFVPELAFQDFCTVAERLFPKAAYAEIEPDLKKSLAMVESMPSRIMIGLRRNDGEWISLAGGWRVGDRAILNMQLNDQNYVRESLSLVLRSYLIEMLIKQGCRELVFWAGSSAPLSLYCTSPHLSIAYIDGGSLLWKLVRLGCEKVSTATPRAFREWIEWIVPAAK